MKKIAIVIASVVLASTAFAATTAPVEVKPSVTSAPTVSAPAKAASTPKVLTAQQQKMVDCNKSATGKKGDDRKSFLSTCLKKAPVAGSTASAPTPTATPAAKLPVVNAQKPVSKS